MTPERGGGVFILHEDHGGTCTTILAEGSRHEREAVTATPLITWHYELKKKKIIWTLGASL